MSRTLARWHLVGLTALWWLLFTGLWPFLLRLGTIGAPPFGWVALKGPPVHRYGSWSIACAVVWPLCVWVWFRSPRQRWLRAVDREASWWMRAVRRTDLPAIFLTRIVLANGNVHAVAALPSGMTPDMLASKVATIATHYPTHRVHQDVEHIVVSPAAENRARRAKVSIIRRTLRTPPELERVMPARAHELYLGEGHRGPIPWDLRAHAHALIAGATRSGKGVLARTMATQALLADWDVTVLDATGSYEWAACNAHPQFTWMPADDRREWYRWANAEMDATAKALLERNQRLGAAGYDNWLHATDDRFDIGPRRLLILDETTATLGVAGDAPNGKAAQALAGKIDTAVRSWAKAGGHVAIIDQAPYQGLTGLSAATRNQLERFVALGDMSSEQEQMVGGSRDWPYVSGERGHGNTGRRGGQPDEIRIPGCSRATVERSIAAALPQERP